MDALDQIAKVRANSKGALKDQREAAYYPSLLRWIILYALTNMPKETHLESCISSKIKLKACHCCKEQLAGISRAFHERKSV